MGISEKWQCTFLWAEQFTIYNVVHACNLQETCKACKTEFDKSACFIRHLMGYMLVGNG